MLLMFQDAILSGVGMARGLDHFRAAWKQAAARKMVGIQMEDRFPAQNRSPFLLKAIRRQAASRRCWRTEKGPRSGGVERRPTKRSHARSIASAQLGQQGENPNSHPQLQPYI